MTSKESISTLMQKSFQKFVDHQSDLGNLNRVEYWIACGVVWELTENNMELTWENNLPQEFINDDQGFLTAVHNAYKELLKKYPKAMDMSDAEVIGVIDEFTELVYIA